ncbi:MAG: hypothetical protein KFW21_04425 [Spirochaetota bacterium]|nr:hypothetical protein [Spirochaetota bacterium]
MDFQKKIATHMNDAKNWMHNHLNFAHKKYHCDMFMNMEEFSPRMEWLHLTNILPGELLEEIHLFALKEHEKFLSSHFKFAKKMKELHHKKEILHLDIIEHCHLKESSFDKKVISESLEALKKTNREYRDLFSQEKERFYEIKQNTEDAIYNKIQDFLKK